MIHICNTCLLVSALKFAFPLILYMYNFTLGCPYYVIDVSKTGLARLYSHLSVSTWQMLLDFI